MHPLPPSQAPLGLPIILASPQVGQDDLAVATHHISHFLGLGARKRTAKQPSDHCNSDKAAGSNFKAMVSKPDHSNHWHNCFLPNWLSCLVQT